MVGIPTLKTVVSSFAVHPVPAVRELVSHNEQIGEGVTGHFLSDFSPSFIYEMGEKEKFLNHFTCFSDEFVALLQLMKSPLSRHDRRCLLQAWDGGKPLDKLDTVRGARARASNAQPLTPCASRR